MSSSSSLQLKLLFDPQKGVMQSKIVQAGAGAGKTTELITRILSISICTYRDQGRWPRIVLTTFTKKATAEIQDRLSQAVLYLQRSSKEFQDEFGFALPEGLFEFIQNPKNVLVGTNHAVLSQFLRQNLSELGYGSHAKLINDTEWDDFIDDLWRDLLSEKSELSNLASEYLDLATECTTEQLKVTLKNVYRKCQQGEVINVFSENQYLDLAQKLRAKANDLRLSILADLNSSPKLTPTTTKFLANLQQDNWFDSLQGEKIDIRRSSTVSDATYELIQELKAIFKQWSLSFSSEAIAKITARSDQLFRFLLALVDSLQVRSKSQSLLTMSDLEDLSLRLIREKPELGTQFALQWDYWMVDEFQDTSPEQLELFHGLRGDSKIYFVGDPQQSIYLFRGARSELFFETKEKFFAEDPNAVEYKLINYRSGPDYLQSVNQFFDQFGAEFSAMEPAKIGSSEPLHVVSIDEENWADLILCRIKQLLLSGVRKKDICILAHRKSSLRSLSQKLKSLGFDHRLHSGKSLYNDRQVVDALILLHFLVNPNDDANFAALWRIPVFGFNEELLLLISQNARKEKTFFWRIAERQHQEIVASLAHRLMRVSTEGYFAVWVDWIRELGLWSLAQSSDPSGLSELNLWKIVLTYQKESNEPGFSQMLWLEKIWQLMSLDEVDEEATEAILAPNRDELNLMTVYASKGLQFEHVLYYFPSSLRDPPDKNLVAKYEKFISVKTATGDGDMKFKSALASMEDEEYSERVAQELNRLVYVGLTRAIQSCDVFVDFTKKTFLDLREKFIRWPNRRQFTFEEISNESQFVEKRPPVNLPTEPLRDLAMLRKKQDLKSTRPQRQAMISAVHQGIDFHRHMEKLRYVPTADQTKFVETKMKNLPANIKNAFLQVLESGFAEFGYCLKDEVGRIDLWGNVGIENEVWIFDYKSGDPNKKSEALEQLSRYSNALTMLSKRKPGHPTFLCALFFDSQGELIDHALQAIKDFEC